MQRRRDNSHADTSRSTRPRLMLYSPVLSAVHEMLFDAFGRYGTESGVDVHRARAGLRGVWEAAAFSGGVLMIGATGLPNLLVIPIARLRGTPILYYLHEPTTLRTKIERGNGIVKSVAWHLVQRFDAALSSAVMVSRSPLKERASTVYGLSPDRIHIAHLLLPPPARMPSRRHRVTLLGRIDHRRGFEQFLREAPRLAGLGLTPTILTGDRDPFDDIEVPAAVDVIAQPDFDEATKASVLNETIVVWNPRRYEISQSGVTADAIRYGCLVLLTPKDPSYSLLRERGIGLDFEAELSRAFSTCTAKAQGAIEDLSMELFDELHGLRAFQSQYLPVITALSRTTETAR